MDTDDQLADVLPFPARSTDEDHESVIVDAPAHGAPVDPPDAPQNTSRRSRRPIVPTWLSSKKEVAIAIRWMLNQIGYAVAFHGIRLPKYAGKTLLYSPIGLIRTLARLLRWASAEDGNYALRQAAATRDDPATWLRLDLQRQRQARWRWTLLTMSAIGAVIVLTIGSSLVPVSLVWLLGAVAVVLLARLGRPGDKPITDRVTEAKAYRKLTAELVRRALLSVQIGAINSAVTKDPNAITFPVEIHRDGPGHLAIVDLPYGVEAADVCARRGRLASGLRLPLDQVWPEPASGHTGRLAMWVGFEPASQMRQPAWPLLRDGQVDVFKPFPLRPTRA